VIVVMRKVKAALRLSRPFTLVAPAVGGLLFSFMGYMRSGGPIWKIPLTAFILAVANYASNVINQIYDREIDRINKPYRPIPAGEMTVDEASSLAILLTISALAMGFSLIGTAFGIILSVIMLFAWIYSSPPLRLRQRLLWSNLAIATPRGALGILAAYSSYSDPLADHGLLVFALGMAVYVFGGNTFKDIPDEPGDRALGVRNFVTVYGSRTAVRIALALMAASALPVCAVSGPYSLPFMAVIVSSWIFAAKRPDVRAGTENTVLWTLFYIGMVAAFISFFASRASWP